MTILVHKPYLVKVIPKGVINTQNFDHVVYGWPRTAICNYLLTYTVLQDGQFTKLSEWKWFFTFFSYFGLLFFENVFRFGLQFDQKYKKIFWRKIFLWNSIVPGIHATFLWVPVNFHTFLGPSFEAYKLKLI